MRLGEILFQRGVITAEQLERALRAQVVHGGRIGTNLAQMGFADLDEVAQALAHQHGTVAALERHFERIDPATAKLVPADVAKRLKAIPLGIPRGKTRELAVALADPHDIAAVDELAFVTGMRIRACVAPELRIAYNLERLYDVQRGHQHRRARPPGGESSTIRGLGLERRKYIELNPADPDEPAPEIVRAIEVPEPIDVFSVGVEPQPPAPRPRPTAGRATVRGQGAQALPADPRTTAPGFAPGVPPSAGGFASSAPTDQPARPVEPALSAEESEEAAAFVEALASLEVAGGASEEPSPEAPSPLVALTSPEPSPEPLPLPLPPEPPLPEAAPLPEAPPPAAPQPEPAPMPSRPALSAAEATVALSNATHRDEIAEALIDYMRGIAGRALVLICREELALGWRGLAPGVGDEVIESIAMPLMVPSIFSKAYEEKELFHGPPPEDWATLQRRLWKLLHCDAPDTVLVVPVVLKTRVVNLVYAHPRPTEVFPVAIVDEVTSLCAACAAAFTRIIRAAKARK